MRRPAAAAAAGSDAEALQVFDTRVITRGRD